MPAKTLGDAERGGGLGDGYPLVVRPWFACAVLSHASMLIPLDDRVQAVTAGCIDTDLPAG
jgi:hypothetical protein